MNCGRALSTLVKQFKYKEVQEVITEMRGMLMARIFTKNLSKKNVMSSDGSMLGTLYNIVIDIQTGELVNLVVKPDLAVDRSRYQSEGNYMMIPFGSVRAIKDVIVADKREAMGR